MKERRSRAAATRTTRWAALTALGLVLGCGGGENVISGFGNSENLVGTAALWASVADELAKHDVTPAVTDEDIQRLYGVIQRRALEGELDAALVLLKLAEQQREKE